MGFYVDDSRQTGALFTGLGYEGSWGDNKRQVEIFSEHLNATGGLLGHPVEPVIYQGDIARGWETLEQEACARFTQDNNVIAVVSQNIGAEVLLKCLADQDVPLVDANIALLSDWSTEDYERFPLFAHVNGLSWKRLGPVYVDRLDGMDYFSGWDTAVGNPGAAPTKVGIIAGDSPYVRESVKHLSEALAGRGYDAAEVAYPKSAEEYPNIVVRFRSEGITHVFLFNIGSVLFPSTAESQRYYPRYALNTKLWPMGLAGGFAPDSQLRGALGIGWAPIGDVPQPYRPEPSATQSLCLDVMEKGGTDVSGELARILSMYICDAGWVLRAAYEAGGGLSHTQFATGLESLADSYVPALSMGVFFGPQHRDGITTARAMAYVEECECFQYKGEPFGL